VTIGKSIMLSAFERWLPYPVYKFVGGPFDGQSRAVRLIETANGMIAPPVWNVSEEITPPTVAEIAEPMVFDAPVQSFAYRFVATNLAHNAGHYEFVS
jgi:hypothetical protein